MAVTFNASAKFGYGGKQFIARIEGRDKKFTFRREFIGRKEGKRKEYTSVMVDVPGLYNVRDIDRRGGADDTFYVVALDTDGEAHRVEIGTDDAMKVATLLDSRPVSAVIGWDTAAGEPAFITGGTQTIGEVLAEEAAETTPPAVEMTPVPAPSGVLVNQLVADREQALSVIRGLMERFELVPSDLGFAPATPGYLC